MSLLERLPNEILAETAGFLDSETLLNVRLLSRNISTTIHHVITQRFCRSRAVFINAHSLNTLDQISLSEKYRASVTTLNIGIHHVPDPDDDSIKIALDHPRYLALLEDQKWLIKSGEAAARLTLALKKLSNCTTIRITDFPYDSDRSFRESNSDQPLTTSMMMPTSIDFVKDLISMTIAAVNTSGCMLETFYIGHEGEGIKTQQLPMFSSSRLGLPFFKLSSLCLILDPEFDESENSVIAYLLDWIKLFPFLRALELSFVEFLTSAQFSLLGRNLHVEGLTSLILSVVDCHYEDLAVFFRRHRDSLHSIRLHSIELSGRKQPWRSILKLIRDGTLIDSIQLSYCFTDEGLISFGAYSQDRKMRIPTESHKFREELDAVIQNIREPSL